MDKLTGNLILVMAWNLGERSPGQQFEEESGFSYNYYRHYDPSTGRYIQSDLIGLAGGVNTYGYALQNPTRYKDPKGLIVPALILGCARSPACVSASIATGQAIVDAITAGAILCNLGVICDPNVLNEEKPNNSNPIEGEPDSEQTCENKKGNKKQTRRYRDDGFPDVDVDWDHSHDGLGKPHSHDWDRPGNGEKPTHKNRKPGRAVQPGDPGF